MSITMRKTLVGATILLAFSLYEPIPSDVEDIYHIWRTTKIVWAYRLWYRLTGRKAWQFDPIETFARYAPPDDDVRIYDEVVEGVPVRFYDAQPRPIFVGIPTNPIVLWIHGGGFAWGSVKGSDRLVQRMAKRSRLTWASVEYRKSPTHAFPAAHDDVLAVARKLIDRSGFRFPRLIVIGASAGGNLAAFLSQALRPDNPEDEHPILAQVLIYPALQAFDTDTPSHHLPYAPIMSQEDVQYFASLYLAGNETFAHTRLCTLDDDDDDPLRRERYFNLTDPRLVPAHLPPRDFDRHQSPRMTSRRERLQGLDPRVVADNPRLKEITKFCEDPRISPLIADDVSRLPPTYIQACEYDVLRDDAIFYAARLRDSGVDVKLDIEEKTYHGIFPNLNSLRGRDMVDKAVTFIVDNTQLFRMEMSNERVREDENEDQDEDEDEDEDDNND